MPSNQYDLSFVAKFVNKLSSGVSKASKDISGFARITRESGSDAVLANASFTSLVHTLGTVSKIAAGITATGAGISAWAIKASFDFDEVMRGIAAKMTGNIDTIHKRIKGLKEYFADVARERAGKTFAIPDIAKAYETGMRFFGDLEDMPKRVEKSIDIGFTGGAKTVTETITLMGEIMQAFGKDSLEEFNRIAVMLPIVMQKGNVTFQEIQNSLGRAAPLAKDMNMTIEEMLALYIRLSRIVGGKASLVGFQLASLFQNLGIKEDVVEILKLVNEETKKLGSPYYGQSGLIVLLKGLQEFGKDPENLKKFFESIGARGKVAAVSLISPEGIKQTEELVNLLLDSSELLKKHEQDLVALTTGPFAALTEYNEMTQSFAAMRIELGDILKRLATPWFESANKGLEKLIEKLRTVEEILVHYESIFTAIGAWFENINLNPFSKEGKTFPEGMKEVPGILWRELKKMNRTFFETYSFGLPKTAIERNIGEGIEKGLSRIEQILLEMSQNDKQPSIYTDPTRPLYDLGGIY